MRQKIETYYVFSFPSQHLTSSKLTKFSSIFHPSFYSKRPYFWGASKFFQFSNDTAEKRFQAEFVVAVSTGLPTFFARGFSNFFSSLKRDMKPQKINLRILNSKSPLYSPSSFEVVLLRNFFEISRACTITANSTLKLATSFLNRFCLIIESLVIFNSVA